MSVRECSECGGVYAVTHHGACLPCRQDKQPIVCPHCEHVAGQEMTSGWITTAAADDAQIAEWQQKQAG